MCLLFGRKISGVDPHTLSREDPRWMNASWPSHRSNARLNLAHGTHYNRLSQLGLQRTLGSRNPWLGHRCHFFCVRRCLRCMQPLHSPATRTCASSPSSIDPIANCCLHLGASDYWDILNWVCKSLWQSDEGVQEHSAIVSVYRASTLPLFMLYYLDARFLEGCLVFRVECSIQSEMRDHYSFKKEMRDHSLEYAW